MRFTNQSPQLHTNRILKRLTTFLTKVTDSVQEHYATIDFDQYPLAKNHVYKWNADELIGTKISFTEFLGTDTAEATPIGDNAWYIPNVGGLKTAFFFPPYGLEKPLERSLLLFDQLNKYLFDDTTPDHLQIYSWSNQCSGYFDAGLEWWGAFLWTISRPGSDIIALIGASSSD